MNFRNSFRNLILDFSFRKELTVMPIFFKPSASDFSLSADSIGNRWLQEPVVRPNGFPLYHWIQTERSEGLLTLEGQELLLKPGDGVLIAPHVPHEYRENDGSGMWFTSFLTFDGKLSDDLYKICAVSPYLFVPAPEGAWFQEWIDRIIDSHFLKNDIDDAALSVGCFEFLTRLFQRFVGSSVRSYISVLRISRAKELLISRPYTTLDGIAALCGYRDVSYFISVFRQQTGTTPKQFRKLYGI